MRWSLSIPRDQTMKSIYSTLTSGQAVERKRTPGLPIFQAALWLLIATPAFAALNINETFSTNPITTGRWNFGVGSNANNQFAYQNSAPAYTGDAAGSLAVHFDSTLPTARFELGLGVTLT